ncbi:PAS domain S-box-containing protein [Hasllibacter halocynthiae]|uniref:histidine kinase n=1 Tax=Hasllibacter halocynthiae TaxID=595589 RepID=A0A2T0X169_9RHOB|nr:PAS domain-containing protein [Hasllibacter halocynthiae]PRY92635.1 PAS domain S-box-containing protein [Hasllibacter halocynthiae]
MTTIADLHLLPVPNQPDRVFAEGEAPSGAFLFSLLQATPDCIKVIEADGTISFMNQNGLDAMGIGDVAEMRGVPWSSFWPEASRETVDAAVGAARQGQRARFEGPCQAAGGALRRWEVSVSPIAEADGRVVRVLAVSRDVTERAEHLLRIEEQEALLAASAARLRRRLGDREDELREKDVALREVDHRVKNSLAMVSAILHAQARSAPAAAEALATAASRVRAVAEVHGAIYAADRAERIEMRDYLRTLAEALSRSLAGGDVKVEHAICERTLTGGEALALGLIVSELIANALRHAFAKHRGTVRVGCEPAGTGRTVLTVEDDGAGFPQGFDLRRAEGLGSKVVLSYAAKLGAEVETGAAEGGGARVRVVF